MCQLFGRATLGGRLPAVLSAFASLREFGKNMASVLDLVSLCPMCICIPRLRLRKCWVRVDAFGNEDAMVDKEEFFKLKRGAF